MKKIAFGSLWSAVLFYGLFVYWIGFFSNPASPVQAGYIITPTGTRILTPTKTPTSTATCNPTGTILGSQCGPTDLIANDQSIIHLEALTNMPYASFSGGVSIFPGYQISSPPEINRTGLLVEEDFFGGGCASEQGITNYTELEGILSNQFTGIGGYIKMDSGGSTPDMNAIGAYSGLYGGSTPELDGLASDLDLSGGHADYVRGMKVDAGNYGGGAASQVGTLYGCWVSLGDGLAITNFGYYEASTQKNVFNGPISTAAFSCYGPVTMQNTPTLSGDVTVDAGIAATPVILHFKNGCYTGHTP